MQLNDNEIQELRDVGYSVTDVELFQRLDVHNNLLYSWFRSTSKGKGCIPAMFFESVAAAMQEIGVPAKTSYVVSLYSAGYRSLEEIFLSWKQYEREMPEPQWAGFCLHAPTRYAVDHADSAAEALVLALNSPDASYRELCSILSEPHRAWNLQRMRSATHAVPEGTTEHAGEVRRLFAYLPEELSRYAHPSITHEELLEVGEKLFTSHVPGYMFSEHITPANVDEFIAYYRFAGLSKAGRERHRVIVPLIAAGVEHRKIKALPLRVTNYLESDSIPALGRLLNMAPARQVVSALENAYGSAVAVEKMWRAGQYELPVPSHVYEAAGFSTYSRYVTSLMQSES